MEVLITDDDAHIREVLRFALARAGFAVREAKDGAACVAAVRAQAPDLVILDVVMPELDGTDACRAIRLFSTVPILFLSSRDEEVDKIVALELGGDDYVTKPFSPAEVVARVRAMLRRATQRVAAPEAVLERGSLRLDAARFEVKVADAIVVLTATEFSLLRALMLAPGRVLSRDQLMQQAYDEPTVVSDRTIDSHIRRVRQKLSAHGVDPIATVHGVGYRFVA